MEISPYFLQLHICYVGIHIYLMSHPWIDFHMFMYDWVPLLSTWKYHNSVIGYIPIQNKKVFKMLKMMYFTCFEKL